MIFRRFILGTENTYLSTYWWFLTRSFRLPTFEALIPCISLLIIAKFLQMCEVSTQYRASTVVKYKTQMKPKKNKKLIKGKVSSISDYMYHYTNNNSTYRTILSKCKQ